MNKCPRCENENLKEDYNYCPVCGVLISQDHRETVISNLKIIRDGFKEMECYDSETEETKLVSICSLDVAIRELERTAPEVSVQEQPKTLEFINKEFDINLSQKQYDDIAIFDLCTQKYTAYEILKLLKMLEII